MNKNRIIRSVERQRSTALGSSLILAIALDVAEPSAASGFLSALGLSAIGDDGMNWAISGESRPCLTLMTNVRKQLLRLTFGCPPSQISTLRDRAVDAGHAVHAIAGENGFLLSGPDNIEVAVVACGDVQAPRPQDGLILAHAPSRTNAPTARPLALSHVAIFVTDVDAALAFYIDIVGLRLSDRCGSELAFLHSPHGSGHHILALIRSGGPGLHHYSFEMGTVDAIGLRAAHLAEAGYTRGWGMGRHVLGSNLFHYVRDPWGSHAELTTGLDYIAADTDWVAGDHAAQDAFYLWGPAPPAGFIDNPELQTCETPVAA